MNVESEHLLLCHQNMAHFKSSWRGVALVFRAPHISSLSLSKRTCSSSIVSGASFVGLLALGLPCPFSGIMSGGRSGRLGLPLDPGLSGKSGQCCMLLIGGGGGI